MLAPKFIPAAKHPLQLYQLLTNYIRVRCLFEIYNSNYL